MKSRWRPGYPAGYSLLEMMLALGLLGALMAAGWSLLGTYRDAEQRGWNLSERTRLTRTARQWLEQDLLHLAPEDPFAAVLPSATLGVGSPSATVGAGQPNVRGNPRELPLFVGSPMGFTASLVPSLDPLPFFERLVGGNEDELDDAFGGQPAHAANQPTVAGAAWGASLPGGLGAASLESALGGRSIPPRSSPWPPSSLQVQYLLQPEQLQFGTQPMDATAAAATDGGTWALVRRELIDPDELRSEGLMDHSLNDPMSRFGGGGVSERELTSADLYRQSEAGSFDMPLPMGERRLRGLVQPRFAYCDGRQWQASWNSYLMGSLPTAVALSFDWESPAAARAAARLSPSSSPAEPAFPASATSQAGGLFQDGVQGGPGGAWPLAAEPLLDGLGQDHGLEPVARDVRVVIWLEGRNGGLDNLSDTLSDTPGGWGLNR